MIERITNIIDKFKSMKTKELETYKIITIFLIVADLFGVWYYLKLKSLGGALLLILMVFLALILFLEKNSKGGENKMNTMTDNFDEDGYLNLTGEEEPTEEEPKEAEDKEANLSFGDFEFGMPTPESCANALKCFI